LVKVLVVEDSILYRNLLCEGLSKDPEIKIVAAVGDAYAARDAIIKYRPDVMTLDVELPKMSGLEFLRKLIPQYPMPVVVISALSDTVFDMLDAGAVDFVVKKTNCSGESMQKYISKELVKKIKIAAVARISNMKLEETDKKEVTYKDNNKIIAIGASTGGTEATVEVLKEFEANSPGMVVVQHMPEGFTNMYAKRLDKICKMKVKEADAGDIVKAGQVLIAPAGKRQMRVIRSGSEYRVVLNQEEKVSGHCPSVDVLFDSVAKVAGKKCNRNNFNWYGSRWSKGTFKYEKSWGKDYRTR